MAAVILVMVVRILACFSVWERVQLCLAKWPQIKSLLIFGVHMGKEFVYMGSLVRPWMSNKNIKYITFSVTDDCNLMCEYCYFTHKNNKNKMSFEVAKEA